MDERDASHVPEGDRVTPSADEVVRRLDALPQARERAQLGLRQAQAGDTVELDELEFRGG